MKTSFRVKLDFGKTRDVMVPRLVESVFVMRTDISAGSNFKLHFKNSEGELLYCYELAGTGMQVHPIPLSKDCATITVTNSGSLTSSFELFFE